MLFWIWEQGPYRQKMGIMSGVRCQLALRYMKRSFDASASDGSVTAEPDVAPGYTEEDVIFLLRTSPTWLRGLVPVINLVVADSADGGSGDRAVYSWAASTKTPFVTSCLSPLQLHRLQEAPGKLLVDQQHAVGARDFIV